jgi:hypothetical protein
MNDFQLFVGGLMSYLCYLYLFAHSGVQHILLGKDFESEGKDRYNMELPGKQLTLLQDAVKYGKCSFSITILMLENTEGTIKKKWTIQRNWQHIGYTRQ